MDSLEPFGPKPGFRERRLRKGSSQPRRQNVSQLLPGNNLVYPAQYTQSAVNLVAPTPLMNEEQQSQYPCVPPRYRSATSPLLAHQFAQQHNWLSTTDLPDLTTEPAEISRLEPLHEKETVQDVVADKFSDIIALIDEDSYSGPDRDIVIAIPEILPSSGAFLSESNSGAARTFGVYQKKSRRNAQQPQSRDVNVLSKLSYYSNSRLPSSLPPFRVCLSTYPLLCLAALCSSNAYGSQNAVKNEQLIEANARIGTKAMVIKSVTCSDERTLVFAIRGTSILSLRDWNVNLNTTPESPAGFLDDEGNYCHAGFLRVAKAMVTPIATRLRHLLEENPNRMSYSLLITGHSAGGAVASLLYAHMMSGYVRSELTILTDCFKRVDCVTFGAPPVSLLPLRKPPNKEHRLRKCLFHSFINEGDPVARAEKAYIMSLVDLLTSTPASASSLLPNASAGSKPPSRPSNLYTTSMSMLKMTNLGDLTGPKKPHKRHNRLPLPPRPSNFRAANQIWDVPPGTLSNAGRLVVLRGPGPRNAVMSQVDLSKEFEEVGASTVTDDEIRKVIFGDPLMHSMDVYRRRIEALAMKAATGRDRYY